MSERRTCKYEPCSKEFEPTHPRHEFCEPTCRANQHYLEHPEKGRRLQGGALRSVATQPIAEVRAEQEAAKSHWSAIVREGIIEALRTKGEFFADDLQALGIPDEHRSIIGSQTAKLVNQKWMVEEGRRKSTVASRNGAKSGVYRPTELGTKSIAGIDIDPPEGITPVAAGSLDRPAGFSEAPLPADGAGSDVGVDSGDDAPGVAPLPAPGASPDSLTLLPEPPRLLDVDSPRAA